jgi:hypothetical protein
VAGTKSFKDFKPKRNMVTSTFYILELSLEPTNENTASR